MKFKVRDRVICTRNTCGYATKNKKGTIKKLENKIYMVDFDENVGGWEDIDLEIKRGHGVAVDDEDLELIEENTGNKQFTLDDLKVGYLVELRDGKLRMVMESTNGKVLIDEYNGFYLKLEGYSDNFKDEDGDSQYDIIKVYGFDEFAYKTLDFNTEDRELLWERKEGILNDAEKEYLGSFIKPFRGSVGSISKESTDDYEFIVIDLNDELVPVSLPMFVKNKYYENMETNKEYTLEELEL